MEARQEIALQLRNLIITDRQKGVSLDEIGKKYSIPKSTVQKLCGKFTATRQISNLPGRGRKRAATVREDGRIIREIKKKPDTSSSEIKDQLNLNVSTKRIRRRLHEHKYFHRVSLRKPNKKARLEFAKKHIDKPISFWKKFIWSDESKFELVGKKKRRKIYRRVGEALLDKHTTKTVKHGGGSIMVWGCFSWFGVGNLVRINGILTAPYYINILAH